MNYKDTIEKAKTAMKLYTSGKSHKEVYTALGISRVTLYRYYGIMGGLTNDKKELHYKNLHRGVIGRG